jgi:hemerythrin-like metal-binding protein
MAFLSWHERFSLGHAEIDAQHKKLFELVNRFDDVIKAGQSETLGPILGDLLVETTSHFEFEIALLKQIGFPKRVEHERMHRELIGQIRDLQSAMTEGGHISTKAIVRFLADWLTSHILREDLEYKPYLKAPSSPEN